MITPGLNDLFVVHRIGLCYKCHRARYITHFYCLAVEASFYSDVVECLPVDPVTCARFTAGAGKIFLLYDNDTYRK